MDDQAGLPWERDVNDTYLDVVFPETRVAHQPSGLRTNELRAPTCLLGVKAIYRSFPVRGPPALLSSLFIDTMDVNFRKIDVDAYDEDVLLETEICNPDPRGPQQAVEEVRAKAAAVRTLLAK